MALTRNYPKGLTRGIGEVFYAFYISIFIGFLFTGFGFAMGCNLELMCVGAYVLMESIGEWYQIGPSWFRRKMISMDYVLAILGVDDEVDEKAQGADPSKKTRMTLKEFMLSDSQRA